MGVITSAGNVQRLTEQFDGFGGLHGHLLNQFESPSSPGCSEQMAKAYPENPAAMKAWSQLGWCWFGVELDIKAELAEAAG